MHEQFPKTPCFVVGNRVILQYGMARQRAVHRTQEKIKKRSFTSPQALTRFPLIPVSEHYQSENL